MEASHRLKFDARLLLMIDYAKEKAQRAKVLKKLLNKWLAVQATASKARVLLSKNPELKVSRERRDP